mmetsp:Transcript_41385/g.81621  ORF Transcript_41385/g.81621 Transcript_41385/m.81621 type:complete len:260 (-) Transcript_41385:884-1663(-)
MKPEEITSLISVLDFVRNTPPAELFDILCQWSLLSKEKTCDCGKVFKTWKKISEEVSSFQSFLEKNYGKCTCRSTRYTADAGMLLDRRLSQMSFPAKLACLWTFAESIPPKQAWALLYTKGVKEFEFSVKQVRRFYRHVRIYVQEYNLLEESLGGGRLGGRHTCEKGDECDCPGVRKEDLKDHLFGKSTEWRTPPPPGQEKNGKRALLTCVQVDEICMQTHFKKKKQVARETEAATEGGPTGAQPSARGTEIWLRFELP